LQVSIFNTLHSNIGSVDFSTLAAGCDDHRRRIDSQLKQGDARLHGISAPSRQDFLFLNLERQTEYVLGASFFVS